MWRIYFGIGRQDLEGVVRLYNRMHYGWTIGAGWEGMAIWAGTHALKLIREQYELTLNVKDKIVPIQREFTLTWTISIVIVQIRLSLTVYCLTYS